jgi:hypothetical protein
LQWTIELSKAIALEVQCMFDFIVV